MQERAYVRACVKGGEGVGRERWRGKRQRQRVVRKRVVTGRAGMFLLNRKHNEKLRPVGDITAREEQVFAWVNDQPKFLTVFATRSPHFDFLGLTLKGL